MKQASTITPINKAAIARAVYDDQEAKARARGADMIRKDVVVLIMQQANLSSKGAQTYYQTIKTNKAKARRLAKANLLANAA